MLVMPVQAGVDVYDSGFRRHDDEGITDDAC
jgi:hypothetical protein